MFPDGRRSYGVAVPAPVAADLCRAFGQPCWLERDGALHVRDEDGDVWNDDRYGGARSVLQDLHDLCSERSRRAGELHQRSEQPHRYCRIMSRLRMVPVLRVADVFHARVVAARLGSEGIVTQLRGGIDNPYPTGDVEVLVTEEDLDAARELLLADEVEASYDDVPDLDLPDRRTRRYGWGVVLALILLLVVADIVVVATR